MSLTGHKKALEVAKGMVFSPDQDHVRARKGTTLQLDVALLLVEGKKLKVEEAEQVQQKAKEEKDTRQGVNTTINLNYFYPN